MRSLKGEAVDAAKIITKFADDNKALVIKGGYMDGDALSAEQVQAIAKLDNRETTLAKLAGAYEGFYGEGSRCLQRLLQPRRFAPLLLCRTRRKQKLKSSQQTHT